MALDVFSISALVDEFRGALVGGRVQDVIDVDALSIGLEIYASGKRHYLLLCAEASQPRACLSETKLRRGAPRPSQLGLLLRRYVEGGIVTGASQPPWERLLELEIESRDGAFRLIAELMPRRANVLLVREGRIVDCLNRVGPQQNRVRLSLPNHDYAPPPPLREQLDPARLSEADLAELLRKAPKASTPAFRALPGRVLGMSPLLAKEVVFRATGDPTSKARDAEAAALYAAFQELLPPLLNRQWRPGIGSQAGVPSVACVFPLRQMEWRDCATISQAISRFFGAITSGDAYEAAKKPVRRAIKTAKSRLEAKAASLESGLRDDKDLERLKQSGELILAYQRAIASGQNALRAQYEADAPALVIPLDPARSPLENAQRYFRRYDKAKSARRSLPGLVQETRLEARFLEQLSSDLELAANWLEIDDVIQNLQERGHWQGERRRRMGGGRAGPLRVVSRDGYVVWVGRNSRQNAQLTFKLARADDIWLHARDVPGAHVVIRNDGRRIQDALIEAAAAVAAWHSARRSDSSVPVDYTRVKYVRAIKGAGPGMASYRNERTLLVRPRDESVLK